MNKKSTLRDIFTFLSGYRADMILSLIFSAASVFFMLCVPSAVGRAIDLLAKYGIGAAIFPKIIYHLAFSAVFAAAGALFQWFSSLLNNKIVYGAVADLRRAAAKKLSSVPVSYIDGKTGDILSRIVTDAEVFADGLLLGFSQLFSGVLTILGTLGFMFAFDVKIALCVVVLTPLSLLFARTIVKKSYSLFGKQAALRAEQTAVVDEAVCNLALGKAYSREKDIISRFDKTNEDFARCSVKATFVSSLVNPTTRFVNSIVFAAVGVFGAAAVIGGSLSVGVLSCFLSYASQYTRPFNEISGVVTEMQNALACASRLFDFINGAPDERDGEEELSSVRGEIEFRSVRFSYAKDKELIKDFSFRAKPGQKIALVGPTGCGKTTIINLLMRFYKIDSGEILLDGHNINDLKAESLRSAFGMVLQDSVIFSGTVADNIRFLKPDATEKECEEAAKNALAHEFISRLPQGYNTLLQEGGDGLSEGQKQLLCIARLMIKLPPVVILDEATSSIDARTERRIKNALDRLTEGRTSIIVAHRLSTIRSADRIIVMDGGRIVETGTHKELLSRGGFYSRLYKSQFSNE